MIRYLITGFSGFVCKHFLDYLEKQEEIKDILGIDIQSPHFSITEYIKLRCSFKKIDMLDKTELNDVVVRFKPNYILHLASYSSVSFSWKKPETSFVNNTNIYLNLLEIIRLNNIDCRILSVGSSEEYGKVSENKLPLKETDSLSPLSPYAVARVSQEMLSKIYVDAYKLDIVLTRSFNHIGPGQSEIFAVASFAKQIVSCYKKKNDYEAIRVGNVNVVRDFIDVRDVVDAYNLLLKKGKKGEVYNVCSGNGITLNDIIMIMVNKLNLKIDLLQDKSLLRPVENKMIVGSNDKITKTIGWKINYNIQNSIDDIIDYWINKE